jgi:hypothetical protein
MVRSDNAATRFNDVISRQTGIPPQLLAAHNALLHLVKSHQFDKILLVARSCAVDAQTENYCLNSSITRQLTFLRNLVPQALKNRIVEWKAVGVSAHKNDFVDQLAGQLQKHGPRTAVWCVRVDHMTRSAVQCSRLVNLFAEGGHGAVSFHWDHKTHLEVAEAFQLDRHQSEDQSITAWEAALESQFRAPRAPLNWSVIQPILWILGTKKR